jgi:hypothetical protein
LSTTTTMSATTTSACPVSGSSRHLALGDLALLGLAPWFSALGHLVWGVAVLGVATWVVR